MSRQRTGTVIKDESHMTSVAQPKDKAGSTKAQVDEALHRRPAATHDPVPPPIQAIVDAKDRTDARPTPRAWTPS